MLLLLALIVPKDNTKLLFNSYYQVLSDCYNTYSSLIYNQNIKRISVNLLPTNNTACNAFSSGIIARLVLENVNITDLLETTLTDFDYATTTQIDFDNIPELTAGKYAVLYIYTLSEITEVKIGSFSLQKSALQECYYSIDAHIVENEIQLSLAPTGKCVHQIVINALSQLRYVSLIINGVEFGFDPADIAREYYSGAPHTIIKDFGAYSEQILVIKQEYSITARLYLTCVYGAQQIEFFAPVGKISIAGYRLGFFDDKQQFIGLFDNGFSLYSAQSDLYFSTLKADYDAVTITQCIVRLTITLNSQRISLVYSYMYDKFDAYRRVYRFFCTYGSDLEIYACENVHSAAMQQQAKYKLDLLFYNVDMLVFIESTPLVEVPSCYKSIVIQQTSAHTCFYLITRDDLHACELIFPSNASIKVKLSVFGIDTVDGYDITAGIRPVEQEATITRKIADFCLNCRDLQSKDNCYAVRSILLRKTSFVLFKITSLDPLYTFKIGYQAVIGFRRARTSYMVTQALVFSLGGILIAICLVISVISMIAMMRSIKESKRKRAK